ncbi:carbohydrate kinase [Lecanosticta acicola]|uniref:Gluconokinase n=1 Tax=Lecanosticta acicola TaxID=111012 RepID=A0AAI8YXZ8_9PEZI|nr:carbohydrate kinase [Lecanosticta acicola]
MQTTTQRQHNLPPTPPSEPTTASDLHPMASKADSAVSTFSSTSPLTSSPPRTKHIWVITGPAGCGKTSVAEHLHQTFDLPYLEGDAFHPPGNVKKMAEGQPLTDADRWDWLILLRETALETLLSESSSDGVIVTCSALKRKYRDVMRIAAYHHPHVRVHFVFLKASEAVLMERVRARQGHYMKDYMVRSQFESLEIPTEEELGRDVLAVDASGTSEVVKGLALEVVREVMDA